MDWISDKTIVITGASSGIGKALTEKLVRKYGCRVIGIGQSEDKLHYLQTSLTYMSEFFSFEAFDISEEDNWQYFVRNLKEQNLKVDVLINCAGMLPMLRKINDVREEEVEECFGTNYNGSRYAVKHLMPLIKESDSPAIINILSIDALLPFMGTSLHSASQAALLSYSKSLVAEVGREMYIGYMMTGLVKTDYFRNQHATLDPKLMNYIKLTPEKAASKIIRCIQKQKVRSIIGRDAKGINRFYKISPTLSVKWYEFKVKHSKMKLFDYVK